MIRPLHSRNYHTDIASIFILYVWGISAMKDIRRLYRYHGAEHKCINCIENIVAPPCQPDYLIRNSGNHGHQQNTQNHFLGHIVHLDKEKEYAWR